MTMDALNTIAARGSNQNWEDFYIITANTSSLQ